MNRLRHMRVTFTTLRRPVPFSLRLLTGAVFYQYLKRSLEASVDTDLQIRAQRIASGLVLHSGTFTLRDVTAALPCFGTATQGQGTPPADVNEGALVRLLDAHGTRLAETPAFRALRVPAASVTKTGWAG